MRLRKIGAVLAGAAMLGATLASAVIAGDQPAHEFWVNNDGTPAAMIVVGDSAAASDVVSASLIAAKVGTMAVLVEEKAGPATVYSDTAIGLPLAYPIESWRNTIPWQVFNLGPYDVGTTGAVVLTTGYYPTGTPPGEGTIGRPIKQQPAFDGEGVVFYYKTWGITTHWTPNDNAYVLNDDLALPAPFDEYGIFKFFNGVKVEYTLGSLWFFDEDSRTWLFTVPDGVFEAWETHEEIQIRFDDLYMVGGKEFQLSGIHFQDHKADLAGGDVVPEGAWTWGYDPVTSEPITFNWLSPDIPGLIYRIDNIRRPRMFYASGLTLTQPRLLEETKVDLHREAWSTYAMAMPYDVSRGRLPMIRVFGKDYKVVDAGPLDDFNYWYRSSDENWELGRSGHAIIAGNPRWFGENYLYKDEPKNFSGYELLVKDVDVDHNKIYAAITDPAGDTTELWMVLDPMHGFSPNIQQYAVENTILTWYIDATGKLKKGIEPVTYDVDYYNKWMPGNTLNDVYFYSTVISYRDNSGHAHDQFEYLNAAFDGIATFVGAGGTVGALFNVWTLEDPVEFVSQNCCVPYVEEPNNYSLWIDMQLTTDPCTGNNFVTLYEFLDGADLDGPGWEYPWKGPWDSIDSHCTTTYPIPPSVLQRDWYTYTHWIEAVPDSVGEEIIGGYYSSHVDLDPYDILYTGSSAALVEGDYTDPLYPPYTIPATQANDWSFGGADYMWEMNFALCDVLEAVNCTTKWVIVGPNNYFRIEMSDITWDDDGNGWAYKWIEGTPEGTWVPDQLDDGIDFRVVMEVSSGTYKQTTSVAFDPTTIVKLDVEVTEDDMAAFNFVLVGGPVANVLVKKLVDMGKTPDDGSAADWAVTSAGDYKLYTNGFDKGKDVLVVAGANREETRKAAEELVAGMG